MARDFDGLDDQVDFGSNAQLDDLSPVSCSAWYNATTLPVSTFDYLAVKISAIETETFFLYLDDLTTPGTVRLGSLFVHVSNAHAIGNTNITTGVLRHLASTWVSGAAPKLYINGVEETYNTSTADAGPRVSDADNNLIIGDAPVADRDADGQILCLALNNAEWSLAQINQARWYGKPFGTIRVYHPMFTTKLTNEGTTVANGTPTGTTMASLPRVERCWVSMMGCGR